MRPNLTDFSDALEELENEFPNSNGISLSGTSGDGLLNVEQSLYFCIPDNDQLLQYWDTVANRLFNIRHCKNIAGLDQTLALFEPRINPELLIQAQAQGISIGSVLADLETPAPFYRFNYMLQKANEFCNEVKSLAGALLSALEKTDAEALARLHASQETGLLNMITTVKEKQVLEAEANKEGLLKSRETAKERLKYYAGLIGLSDQINDDNIPESPDIPDDLPSDYTFDDTNLPDISVDLNVALSGTDESGVKIIPKEKEEMDKNQSAFISHQVASSLENLAGIFHLFPKLDEHLMPFGIGASAGWGGQNLGLAASSLAKVAQLTGDIFAYQSSQAAKMASYIRREQEWTQQATLAEREIQQIDKQIIAAEIRLQIANQELKNHNQQIQNAQDNLDFLQNKFTNQELHSWMKNQLYIIYKQSYNLAYDMAKKAEKAYRFELGISDSNFVQYGYWDSTYKGLVSGDGLQFALKQMEKSFIEENRREFEIIKHISLNQLDPFALLNLKQIGICNIDLPEELFDMDYYHYFRRIKSVRITIPAITGPYISVNCTLTLLKNKIRITTVDGNNNQDLYAENYEANPDPRFVENIIPFTSIVTSSAQNDNGMPESAPDERWKYFEGAGVNSSWKIELNNDFRQFDYNTISDVIFHITYTARAGDDDFNNKVQKHLDQFINGGNAVFHKLFSLKNDFPNQFYTFMNPPNSVTRQITISITEQYFPYWQIYAQNAKDLLLVNNNPPQLFILTKDRTLNDGPDIIVKSQNNSLLGGWTVNSGDSFDADITYDILMLFDYNLVQAPSKN